MTFDKVRDVMVSTLSLDADEIKPESSLKDDLQIDSLDVVELIMALEEEFGLKIENEEAKDLTTVQAICDFIDKKKA